MKLAYYIITNAFLWRNLSFKEKKHTLVSILSNNPQVLKFFYD